MTHEKPVSAVLLETSSYANSSCQMLLDQSHTNST